MSQRSPRPKRKDDASALQQFQVSNRALDKIFTLRDNFVGKYGEAGDEFYDYQKAPSNAIIESVLTNSGESIPVEFSRQSGKTEMVVDTVLFIKLFYFSLARKLGIPHYKFFNTLFFAPQKEQAKTDFDRMKGCLDNIEKTFGITSEEANGNTIRLSNNTASFCFTLSPTSHPESKTANLIILEEAQDLIDQRIDKVALPMGANTNATVVYIGTAGYRKCNFKKILDTAPIKFINNYESVLKQKQARFKATNNPLQLNYARHIDKRSKELGPTSDEFNTQYALKWILERGQFIVHDALMALQGDYDTIEKSSSPCVAGIDHGKINDSTVVTVMDRDYRIFNWLELHGDDYDSQYYIIKEWLEGNYPGCVAARCDSTGNQDMIVDRYKNHMRLDVEGVVMGPQRQDQLYKATSGVMHDKKDIKGNLIESAVLSFPKTDCPEKDKFIRQFLDLQKEIKNNRWSCEAPKGKEYHDDFCDSTALAVDAVGSAMPDVGDWDF